MIFSKTSVVGKNSAVNPDPEVEVPDEDWDDDDSSWHDRIANHLRRSSAPYLKARYPRYCKVDVVARHSKVGNVVA